MNSLFKMGKAIQVKLYRMSRGKLGGKLGVFNVCLLNTTGRKSSKAHAVPIGYFEQPGGYLFVAANDGRSTHPAWYHNLKNNPQVTIQVFDKIIPVTGEVLSGKAREKAWQHVSTTVPPYAESQKRTTREIP